jgi:hypothetical protein
MLSGQAQISQRTPTSQKEYSRTQHYSSPVDPNVIYREVYPELFSSAKNM